MVYLILASASGGIVGAVSLAVFTLLTALTVTVVKLSLDIRGEQGESPRREAPEKPKERLYAVKQTKPKQGKKAGYKIVREEDLYPLEER
ncbi:MAG: hypothetical protein IJF71_07210 [Clostridia bacterium]|nr:hypothetical protein [Clostridia bacterium]